MVTIGIDFGTTKTMAAWVNPKTGIQEVINLGEEHNYIPTSVFLHRDGQMCFGDEADEHASDAPERYARGFKMKLGSSSPALFFFKNGKSCIYTALQLTSAFLRHVKRLCEERACFSSVNSAVITRPVDFSPAQLSELRMAAEQAGFSDVAFVTEPEAAGYAFCALSPEQAFRHSALIVDWGGGTLDMAIVTRTGDKVKTDGEKTAGENMMGGEVFDAYLWQYVTSAYAPHGINPEAQSPSVRYAAHTLVRKTKESLSKRNLKEIRLTTDRGAAPALPVSRAAFEALIQHDVRKAVDAVLRLIRTSGDHKPEMLLLVGGTSLIPLVRREMESGTGLPARQWQYVREAVALGAALWNVRQDLLYEQYRKRAEDCYRFNEGNLIDFRLTAELYKRGHEAGDLNCTYRLAGCYMSGEGVPRQFEKALELAQYLVDKKCPLGLAIIGKLYCKGWGVPLDRNRGRNYLLAAKQGCAAPLPGIDEDIRFLLLSEIASDLGLEEEKRHWGREYAKAPRAFWPWGFEASTMIGSEGQLNEEEKDRLRSLLSEGCQQNDPLAMIQMGNILGSDEDSDLFPPDPEQGKQLILRASTIVPYTTLLLMRLMITGEDEDAARMWDSARLGVSLIPASGELGCEIRICSNIFGAAYRVHARNVATQKRVEDMVITSLPPRIVIRNCENASVPFFDLRVCAREMDYDRTFSVRKEIKPGETLDIGFDDYDLPVADQMMVEVSYNGRKSMIDYADFEIVTVPQFISLDGSSPALFMIWEKGFFGGIKLILFNEGEEPITGISVIKQSGAHTNRPITLAAGDSCSLGWSDFNDATGLQENEVFYIEFDEGLPVVGRILTHEGDDNGTGLGTLLKIGGAVLLGGVGLSS